MLSMYAHIMIQTRMIYLLPLPSYEATSHQSVVHHISNITVLKRRIMSYPSGDLDIGTMQNNHYVVIWNIIQPTAFTEISTLACFS